MLTKNEPDSQRATATSVQTHSYASLVDDGPMLPPKNSVTPAKAGAHSRNGSRPAPGRRWRRRGIESECVRALIVVPAKAGIPGTARPQPLPPAQVRTCPWRKQGGRLKAFAAATITHSVPALSALLAIPLLDEWPNETDWVGIVLISAGVYLTSGGPLPRWNL